MKNARKTPQHYPHFFNNKIVWLLLLLTATVLVGTVMSCHKNSHQPDCGCDAVITDEHFTGTGHINSRTDTLGQKIWEISLEENSPGKKTTISICNLNDPVVKEVTDDIPGVSMRVRFAGKVHKECPPTGPHIPEYEHMTMTIDTLTPIVMQPM